MKRSATLLLTALLLACFLTACGGDRKDSNSNTATDSNTTQSGTDQNTGLGNDASAENNTPIENNNDRDNPIAEAGDAVEDTVEGAVNGAEHALDGTDTNTANGTNSRAGGATYGEMLRNGMVHDRDGFLNDGENAVTPGTL